jgi:hypothetical protein
MTAPKREPIGELSKVGNRSFELWAFETLEGAPTATWETIDKLWRLLGVSE